MPSGRPSASRALVDRPVAAAAERLVGARRDVDLDVLPGLGAALDLGDRERGVVLADQDRGLQPRLAAAPVRKLPLIDGALDRGAEFEILLREDEEVEHLQDAELDIERIEMLLAHEGEIGAGRPAGRRPGVAPRDQGRGTRIGRGADIGRAQMVAVGLQMLLPALRQERIQVGARMQARMDVAIDDAKPALGARFLFEQRAVDDITHAILLQVIYAASFSRGKVSSGLSAHMRETMLSGRCGGIASSPSNCQCG